jgi:hypothetical protein
VVWPKVGRFALNNKILLQENGLQRVWFHASVGMSSRRTSGFKFLEARARRGFSFVRSCSIP